MEELSSSGIQPTSGLTDPPEHTREPNRPPKPRPLPTQQKDSSEKDSDADSTDDDPHTVDSMA